MRVEIISHAPSVTTRTSGDRFELVEDYRAVVEIDGQRRVISVPAGFWTDFASVPRLLWAWAAPHGRHSLAALVHDYLYFTQMLPRRVADEVFYQLMRKLGVRRTKAWAMWAGVRLGGWTHWEAE